MDSKLQSSFLDFSSVIEINWFFNCMYSKAIQYAVPFVYLYLIIPYSLPQKNQELNLRSLLKLVVQVTESLSNVRQKVVNRVCFSRLIIQVCLHLRLLHKSCAFFKVVFSQSFFVVLSYISIKCTNIKILANKDSIIKSAGKCLNPSFHYKSR